MRILIVDDSEDNRNVLARRLEKRGFAIEEAPSGPRALAIINQRVPDLILLDWMMPEMSGIDFLKILRQKHSAAELPVIMVTAKAEPQSVVEALEVGANDYVTKPISFPVVLARMQAQLQRKDAEQRLRDANNALELRVAERTGELESANRRLREEIGRREQVEQGLRRAKAEAEQASASKSAFLANMSHELRTPLTAIMGFSEIMLKGLRGDLQPPEYRDYVQDIHYSGQHLLSLIDDILDMSKIEAGKYELQRQEIDLEEIVDHCVRLVGYRAGECGVTIGSSVAPDLPMAFVDVRSFKQIILNLMSNAIKFTPPGGRVDVLAEMTPKGECVICVRDTGIGIAPHDLARVLEPFEQVESSYRRSRGGTGLGLPLARSLIELHGGRLEMLSTLGAGTQVRVYLPPQALLTDRQSQAV